MRLAIFSHWLPEAQSRAGEELALSSARSIHDVAQGLVLRRHDVAVYSFSPQPAGALYPVYPLPGTAFFRRPESRFLLEGIAGNALALFPNVSDRDAVLCFDEGMFLPLKHKRAVRIFHESSALLARFETKPVDKVWRQILAGEQQATCAAYRWMKARTVATSASIRASIPGLKTLIPSGVDRTTFFASVEEKSAKPLVLFHGGLHGRRRGAWLVRVFEDKIRPQIPDAQLVCLGASGSNHAGVQFVPAPTDEEYARWFRQAWVFALPSRFEWSAGPYLEAMASGTAVVATENPESRELLGQGRYGVLAEDELFGEEVARLLRRAEDRDKWAKAGARRAEAFDLAHTLDAYEALLAAPV